MNYNDIKNKRWFPNTVATCSAVILYFLLKNFDFIGTFFIFIWRIICPLVAGTIIAYMIDPIARFLEHTIFIKFKRVLLGRKSAVAISCIIVFGGIFLLLILLIPSIINSITILIGNSDYYETTILSFLNRFGIHNEALKENISILVAKLKEWVPVLTQNVLESSSKMGKTLGNIGLGSILAIYFLLYKKRIVPWVSGIFRKMLHDSQYDRFIEFISRCDSILLKYLACSLLEALFVGVSNAIFMLIFRIPFVVLISVVVGVTNLAPTFGPMIGGITGFIILVLVNPGQAILFVIFTIIIQTVDGYIIKPKLFGDSLGASPLWILISIICGGKIFGVVGVLLAIPFAAIAQYILEEILFPKVKDDGKRDIKNDLFSERLRKN